MVFGADIVIIIKINLGEGDVVEDVEDAQVDIIQTITNKVVIIFIIFVKVLKFKKVLLPALVKTKKILPIKLMK